MLLGLRYRGPHRRFWHLAARGLSDQRNETSGRSIFFCYGLWYGLLKETKNEESSICAGWTGSIDEHRLLPAEAPVLLGFRNRGPHRSIRYIYYGRYLIERTQ